MEHICITGIKADKGDKGQYQFTVRISTGVNFYYISPDGSLYSRLEQAYCDENEEESYSILIQIATEVLHQNDVFFNTIEII